MALVTLNIVTCCNLRTIFCPQAVSDKLMAGFVECLDNEEAEEGAEKGDGEREMFLIYFLLSVKPFTSLTELVF